MDSEEVRRRAAEIDWFQSYEIVPSVMTHGVYEPSVHAFRGGFPDHFTGKSVLEVGSWDGFYSFEAEARGADRVVATDSWAWQGRSPLPFRPGDPTPRFGSKQGFDLVHEARNSKVESVEVDVMDLGPDDVGTFDVVLFFGVLYHLPNPNLGIERVASVCDDLLILETQTDMLLTRRPAAAFYPGAELRGDESNWWGPNLAALTGMLRSAGFPKVEVMWAPGLIHRIGGWAKKYRTPDRRSFLWSLASSRTIVHARK